MSILGSILVLRYYEVFLRKGNLGFYTAIDKESGDK